MSDVANPWDVTTLLCDYAQVADGKLFISGGGWSLCGPGPFVHGLAIKIGVPWHAATQQHTLEAVLEDEDGRLVVLDDQDGHVGFDSNFEVERPTDLPPGTPLDLPLAVNMSPLELPPASGFVWILRIDGVEVSRTAFRTRPA